MSPPPPKTSTSGSSSENSPNLLASHWSLHRIGWPELTFVLQPHLPVIVVGRCTEAHKQCLGKQISRRHFEFRRIETPHNGIQWAICDPSSSTKTYLNGHQIPHGQVIPLNDRDLIGVGANLTRECAEGLKRSFLYQILGPMGLTPDGGRVTPTVDIAEVATDEDESQESGGVPDLVRGTNLALNRGLTAKSCDQEPQLIDLVVDDPDSSKPPEVQFQNSIVKNDKIPKVTPEVEEIPKSSTKTSSFKDCQTSSSKIGSETKTVVKRSKLSSKSGPSSKRQRFLWSSEDEDEETNRMQQVQKSKKPKKSVLKELVTARKVKVCVKKLEIPSSKSTTAILSKDHQVTKWTEGAQKVPEHPPNNPDSSSLDSILLEEDVPPTSSVDQCPSELSSLATAEDIKFEDVSDEPLEVIKAPLTWAEKVMIKSEQANSSDEANDPEEACSATFSQSDEVFILEDDCDFMVAEPKLQIKQEVSDDEMRTSDVERDDDRDDGPLDWDKEHEGLDEPDTMHLNSQDSDVLCLDDMDLESGQKPLFQMMLNRIKREQPDIQLTQEFTVDKDPPQVCLKQSDPDLFDQPGSNSETSAKDDDDEPSQSLLEGMELESAPVPSNEPEPQWKQILDARDDDDDNDDDVDHLEVDKTLSEPVPKGNEIAPKIDPKDKPRQQISGAKMIAPLPMPPRRTHLRGISAVTGQKLMDQQEASEAHRESEKPAEKSPQVGPTKFSFFGKKGRPMSKIGLKLSSRPIFGRSLSSNSGIYVPKPTKDAKELRRARLREIAERGKDESKSEEEVPKLTPPVNIKTSTNSRLSSFLDQETLCPKVPSKKPVLNNRAASTSRILSNNANVPTFKEPFSAEPKPKEPTEPLNAASHIRRVAEKVRDADGNLIVKKLSFSNVISNCASQDLYNLDLPVAEKKTLNYPSILPKTTSRPSKSLRWKPDSELVKIKYIEREGKGLKVSQNYQKGGYDMAVINKEQAGDFQLCMRTVLNWNAMWLEEQKEIKSAPPILGKFFSLCHVPLSFSSYSEYCNSFYPLLLHELWSTAYNDYKTRSEPVLAPTSFVDVQSDKGLNIFCYLNLLQPLPSNYYDGSELSDGWLVKVSLPVLNDSKNAFKYFMGYIESLRIRRMTTADMDKLQVNFKHKPDSKGYQFVGEYRVQLKAFPDRIDTKRLIRLEGISLIWSFLRNLKAIELTTKSELIRPILSPRINFFATGLGNDDIKAPLSELPQIQCLNPNQLQVVKTVARSCTVNMNSPHISLVQGPPGTGKTSTIVALILQIHSRWRQYNPSGPLPRILLTAPSNTAVDEISLRIKAIAGEGNFNIVRIGRERVVHPEIRDIIFENLREKQLKVLSDSQSNRESVSMEIKRRQENMNKLGESLAKVKDQSEIALLNRKIKLENNCITRAKKSLETPRLAKDFPKWWREVSKSILENADIIAVTLNSSMTKVLEQHFAVNQAQAGGPNAHRPFSICIMDEASQCSEPEALIPLRLGFTKMVLVGDPEQLPATVLSNEAKQMSLHQSLFKRFHNFFETEPAAYQTLTVQYRMHKEIMDWPSKYFYGRKLEAGPQNRDSSLRPYLLLDLKPQSCSSADGQIWNEDEAAFVADLAVRLHRYQEKRGETTNIGIITFYAKMRDTINTRLQEKGLNNAKSVQQDILVRTVDGFQGSECDIVIMSCVRTQGHKGLGFLSHTERLNVALTRARMALYVVMDVENFQKGNEMWRSLINNARERNLLEKCALGTAVKFTKK